MIAGRWALVLLTVLGVVYLGHGSAAAAPATVAANVNEGGTTVVDIDEGGGPPAPATPLPAPDESVARPAAAPQPAGPAGPSVAFPVLSNDADGECQVAGSVGVEAGNPLTVGGAATNYFYDQTADLGYDVIAAQNLRGCQGPTAPVTDMTAVYAIARQVIATLPQATPDLVTPYQITGLQTYLQTGRTLTVVHEDTADVITQTANVRVEATAVYDVDWGDGETTTGVTDPGTPYPNGTVTHTYIHTGQVTLSVIDHWRVVVTTDVPGFATLDLGVTSLGPYPLQVPIREVRAVRDR